MTLTVKDVDPANPEAQTGVVLIEVSAELLAQALRFQPGCAVDFIAQQPTLPHMFTLRVRGPGLPKPAEDGRIRKVEPWYSSLTVEAGHVTPVRMTMTQMISLDGPPKTAAENNGGHVSDDSRAVLP